MRLKHVRHTAEIIAIIAAGLWAAYVFVYEERIKPAAQAPRLTLTPSWHVQHNARYDVVLFTLTYKNAGGRVIDVAAEEAGAWGMTAGAPGTHHDAGAPQWDIEPRLYLSKGPLLFSSGNLRAGAEHGNPASHILLYGDQTVDEDYTVLVPRGKYVAIEFDYAAVFAAAPIVPPLPVRVLRGADGGLHIGGGVPQNNGTVVVPL